MRSLHGWMLTTISATCTSFSTLGIAITSFRRPFEHGGVEPTSTDGSNKLCYPNCAQTSQHLQYYPTYSRSMHSTNTSSLFDLTYKDETYTLEATLDYPSFSTPLVSLSTYREMFKTLFTSLTMLLLNTTLTELAWHMLLSYNVLIKLPHSPLSINFLYDALTGTASGIHLRTDSLPLHGQLHATKYCTDDKHTQTTLHLLQTVTRIKTLTRHLQYNQHTITCTEPHSCRLSSSCRTSTNTTLKDYKYRWTSNYPSKTAGQPTPEPTASEPPTLPPKNSTSPSGTQSAGYTTGTTTRSNSLSGAMSAYTHQANQDQTLPATSTSPTTSHSSSLHAKSLQKTTESHLNSPSHPSGKACGSHPSTTDHHCHDQNRGQDRLDAPEAEHEGNPLHNNLLHRLLHRNDETPQETANANETNHIQNPHLPQESPTESTSTPQTAAKKGDGDPHSKWADDYDELVQTINRLCHDPETTTHAVHLLSAHISYTYEQEPHIDHHTMCQELHTITNGNTRIIQLAYDVYRNSNQLTQQDQTAWTHALKYLTNKTDYKDRLLLKGTCIRASTAKLLDSLPWLQQGEVIARYTPPMNDPDQHLRRVMNVYDKAEPRTTGEIPETTAKTTSTSNGITYQTTQAGIIFTTPPIPLTLPMATIPLLPHITESELIQLYTTADNTKQRNDLADTLYNLLYTFHLHRGNSISFIRQPWQGDHGNKGTNRSLLQARQVRDRIEMATAKMPLLVCPNCKTRRSKLHGPCILCHHQSAPTNDTKTHFTTPTGTFIMHSAGDEDYYTFKDKTGRELSREQTNDIINAYSVDLPDHHLRLTTPNNLPKHLRTAADDHPAKTLPQELRHETSNKDVKVFHPTFIQIQQDLQQFKPDTGIEDGKRKRIMENSTFNELLTKKFGNSKSTIAQLLSEHGTPTSDIEQKQRHQHDQQAKASYPKYTTKPNTYEYTLETLTPYLPSSTPTPDDLLTMYESPNTIDTTAIQALRDNPDSKSSLKNYPTLISETPDTDPNHNPTIEPHLHIRNIIRKHQGEIRMLVSQWHVRMGTMPDTKRQEPVPRRQELQALQAKPSNEPSTTGVPEAIYAPRDNTSYWQRTGNIYCLTTFLYHFGQHFTLKQLHEAWLSLPKLVDKKPRSRSSNQIAKTLDKITLSDMLRNLLDQAGIPQPANKTQKDILITHTQHLLIAQLKLDKLGYIPLEPQQGAPSKDSLLWTAQFDERLHLDLKLLRDTNLIPETTLDLLAHPTHHNQPEHWVPATQHYACPREVGYDENRKRCGAISRPVSGHIYTNHTTGRRHRHQCIQCNQQWQWNGFSFAVLITNHIHTLQLFLHSPAQQLRHKRLLWQSRYLAAYEPDQPARDVPPYLSDPEQTTRIHLDGNEAQCMWEFLYRPLTPMATKQLLSIAASNT